MEGCISKWVKSDEIENEIDENEIEIENDIENEKENGDTFDYYYILYYG